MTTLRCYHQPDGRAETIRIAAPAESRFRIDGRAYVMHTWTRAQWDLLAAEDRPAVAWPHGDGMATVALAPPD